MRAFPTRLSALVAAAGLITPAIFAARLVPDPKLPDEAIREVLAGLISTQPASIAGLKLQRVTSYAPLSRSAIYDAELVLNENLYVEVSRSDKIFAPLHDRMAELDKANEQLGLIPKDFVTELGGQKSATSLSFLDHTFIRTAVPNQTRAHVAREVYATHSLMFFGGTWQIASPGGPLAIDTWRGARIAKFSNPLAVDTPDFDRQLKAFLDDAKKTLAEVDDISSKFIARADDERATLFKALPVGAVVAVKDAKAPDHSLFLEVAAADPATGEVSFVQTSNFASKPRQNSALRGVFPDPAKDLRAFLERRRRAEQDASSAPVVALVAPVAPSESPTDPTTATATIEPDPKTVIRGQQTVQLTLAGGAPAVELTAIKAPVPLERIPDETIASERARFQAEVRDLYAATDLGKIYEATIEGTEYWIAVTAANDAQREFAFQVAGTGVKPPTAFGRLLDVERNHPGLRLDNGRSKLPSALQGTELSSDGTTLSLRGSFGTVPWKISDGKKILESGRVVTVETAALLSDLRSHGRGIYRRPADSFVTLAVAPPPEQSRGSSFGSALVSGLTLGLGSLPSITLRFAANVPVTTVAKSARFYALSVEGGLSILPLTKIDSGYTMTAGRLSSGGYGPRPQDYVSGMAAREMDDGVYELTLNGLGLTDVFALVEGSGSTARYYLLRFE